MGGDQLLDQNQISGLARLEHIAKRLITAGQGRLQTIQTAHRHGSEERATAECRSAGRIGGGAADAG